MQQYENLFQGEMDKDRKMSHSWLSISLFTILTAAEFCDYGMVPLDCWS